MYFFRPLFLAGCMPDYDLYHLIDHVDLIEFQKLQLLAKLLHAVGYHGMLQKISQQIIRRASQHITYLQKNRKAGQAATAFNSADMHRIHSAQLR